MVGLTSDYRLQSAYFEVVEVLSFLRTATWRWMSLKTNELVVDLRREKQRSHYPHLRINGTPESKQLQMPRALYSWGQSVLSGSITTWFGNCQESKKRRKPFIGWLIYWTHQQNTTILPAECTSQCRSRASRLIQHTQHPNYKQFQRKQYLVLVFIL